jgi:tetratricopeptide (TPR) repeat protein
MIVKNEEKLILRCLKSVAALADYVLISDTGSTDSTKDIIRGFLADHDIEGKIVDDPWIDFASNRNRALLGLNQTKVDYAFMIDADDVLELADGFDLASFKARMTRDIYDIPVVHAGVRHTRPQLFRNNGKYRWIGVLHEYLEAPPTATRATELGLTIKASIEGSRNADPQKFQKDAEILEKALKTEKTPYLLARYQFYLAQSYRDCMNYEKALQNYLICSKMGFWDQQVYVSLFEAIRCCTRLGGEFEFNTACAAFIRAQETLPSRAEACHAMAFLCRKLGRNKQGMDSACRGMDLAIPQGLFIEPWIYHYGVRDEFAVNAYWSGHYLESLQANLKLLAGKNTPTDMIERLANNAMASLVKLEPRLNLVYSD